MNEDKVFVWVLEIPKDTGLDKFLFSAAGSNREEAESKVMAYIESSPALPKELSPEVLKQWVKTMTPLTPEVKAGCWILQVTGTVSVLLE